MFLYCSLLKNFEAWTFSQLDEGSVVCVYLWPNLSSLGICRKVVQLLALYLNPAVCSFCVLPVPRAGLHYDSWDKL